MRRVVPRDPRGPARPTAPPATTSNLAASSDVVLDRAVRKAAWRLMPLLGLGYLFNYIDRTNVGFAALTMNEALRLTATEFGVASGVFYLGYCLFEVPSNLALHRYGARRWLARIMITWGLAASATALATGARSFEVLRLLCGIAEAGFFPGVIFYLTMWFPVAVRARILAWFMVAIPLSSVAGGPLSATLLGLNGVAGLAGWQWLFIVEGAPACVLGFITLWQLPDGPDTAPWLTDEERDVLRSAIDSAHARTTTKSDWRALVQPRVLVLAVAYCCFLIGVLGIAIWLPQILKGFALTTLQIGLVAAAPYLAAAIVMVAWARRVDHGRRYVAHYAAACVVAAVGFASSVVVPALAPALLGITLAVVGLNAARAPFFSIPPQFLSGAAAAGGLALINSVGNVGGFVGPSLVGWLKDATGAYTTGLLALAALLVVSALLVLGLRVVTIPTR